MSGHSLDGLPSHNRVSIRAVLVHDGEDVSAALAEAGFVDSIAVPVLIGDEPDLSGGILGNGVTPNLIAVLETEQEEPSDPESAVSRLTGDGAQPSAPVRTMLPPAFGMQPLAPVRERRN